MRAVLVLWVCARWEMRECRLRELHRYRCSGLNCWIFNRCRQVMFIVTLLAGFMALFSHCHTFLGENGDNVVMLLFKFITPLFKRRCVSALCPAQDDNSFRASCRR